MILTSAQAIERDIADVKTHAVRWLHGKRIDKPTYREVCQALNDGRCPQAVLVALVDLAFTKRSAIAPKDPVATFRGTLANQEQRVAMWVTNTAAAAVADEGREPQ